MPRFPLEHAVLPEHWIKQTALTFKKRSRDTLVLDQAYRNYYNLDYGPTHEHAVNLLLALHVYLMAKNGKWKDVERNKASKGLMQKLYDELKVAFKDNPKVRKFIYNNAGNKAERHLLAVDIPHSRLGVLYVLANLDVNVDILGHILSGVSTFGAVGALGGISHFGAVQGTGGSATPFSVTGLMNNSSSMGSVVGQTAGGTLAVSGGRGVLGFVGGIAAGTGTATTVGYLHHAPEMPAYPADREPELPAYYRSRRRAVDRGRVDRMRQAASQGLADASIAAQRGWQYASTGVRNIAADIPVASERFVIIMKEAFEGICRKCRVMWSLKPHEISAMVGKVMKALVASAVQYVLGAALPYAGAAMQVGTGVLKTIDAAAEKVSAYLDRRKITMMKGHPQLISEALERRMSWGIGEGLFEVIKGGVNLTAQVFLPGLGLLASAIAAAIEWLTRTIMRVVEWTKLKEYLKKVRKVYEEVKLTHKLVDSKDNTGKHVQLATQSVFEAGDSTGMDRTTEQVPVRATIIYDEPAFSKLFQEGCDISPMVPMLVLNSGVCGSVMTMVRMVNDAGQIIQQSEFDAGVSYLARLKTYSARYIRKSGFTLDPVDKADAFIKNLFGHAAHNHEKLATRATKFWAAATA